MYEMLVTNPNLSDKDINQWFKDEYDHLAELYSKGDKFTLGRIAPEKVAYLNEYLRALYVLQMRNGEDIAKYSIMPNVLRDVLKAYGRIPASKQSAEDQSEEDIKQALKSFSKKGKTKREDKYKVVTQWCIDNAGKKVKVKDVADLVEWSYPTANNFVQSRSDLFSRFAHGVYVLKNPNEDRAKEKNAKKSA